MRSDSDIKHTLENIAADGDGKPFQKAKDHRESGGLLLSTKCVSYFNGW